MLIGVGFPASFITNRNAWRVIRSGSTEIDEIKTVPRLPVSHPFVERLIGSIPREYLDQVLFWNVHDLEKKLDEYKNYYNGYRVHAALEGETPLSVSGNNVLGKTNIDNYQWKTHCRGLFQTPMAA